MIILSPSILAADFARLGEQVNASHAAGCEWLHIDVMDGVFVPNISIGLPVVSSLRKVSGQFFDVHLMIVEPHKYTERFAKAGADLITIHYEACGERTAQTLREIRSYGKKAGVSVSPKTPVEAIRDVLPLCDLVLIMTVEPGYGGQAFIPESLVKIEEINRVKREGGYSFHIEVDGGITSDNIWSVTSRGADVIVAGSSVFGASDMPAAVKGLLEKGNI